MFFKISKNNQETYVDNHKLKNNFVLSTDSHWSTLQGKHGTIYFKGYAEVDLTKFLKTYDPTSTELPKGSFTAICESGNKIYIRHDCLRGYPIYYDKDKCEVSSLKEYDNIAWSDNWLEINTELSLINVQHQAVRFEKQNFVSVKQTSEKIFDILNNEVKTFTKNFDIPIKIVPTGGVDTTLLIGLLKYNNVKHEIIDYEYKKWTYFNKANRELIIQTHGKKYMKIAHTWGDELNVLANGFFADQYFLRDYLPIFLYAKHHNINIDKIADDKFKNSYAYINFIDQKQTYAENVEQELGTFTKYIDINQKMMDIILGTYLLCHIDNTIYWSPFKNNSITNHILSMPFDDVIENAFDITIQKNILGMIDPKLSKIVSDQKNIIDKDSWNQIKFLLKY